MDGVDKVEERPESDGGVSGMTCECPGCKGYVPPVQEVISEKDVDDHIGKHGP